MTNLDLHPFGKLSDGSNGGRGRFARYGLLGIFFLSFSATLWFAFVNLKEAVGAVRSRLAENVVWAGAQVQVEVARFREATQNLAGNSNGESFPKFQSDVSRRFDLLWSRVAVLRSGEIANFLSQANLSSLVKDFQAHLDLLDPTVAAAASGDRKASSKLVESSTVLWPIAQKFASAIMQAETERVSGLVTRRDQALDHIAISLLGLLATAAAALFSLTRARKRAMAMQHAAEEASGRLTDALETMGEGFAVIDRNGVFQIINGRFREIFAEAAATPEVDGSYSPFLIELAPPEVVERLLMPTGAPETFTLKNGRSVEIRNSRGVNGSIVSVVTDATTAVRLVQDLKAARDMAETSNAAKSRFLAMMSHEIRTPLNGVLGLLEVISDRQLTSEIRKYVETALQSAGTLRVVIDDLLDASKIEAGELQIQATAFSPSRLVGEAVDLLRVNAKEVGTVLRDRVDPDICGLVVGDPNRIRQVLINLVGNAIKFTPAGRVDVSLTRTIRPDGAAMLRFSVTDSGIGIPLDKRSDLFRPFQQIDSGYARKFGGTGLGLSISKAVVEMMGGEIGFNSVHHLGSTFWFDIPVIGASAALKTQGSIDESVRRGQDRRPGRCRILLVEDSPTNRMVAGAHLRSLDAIVDHAENGEIAVERARRFSYDIILMDISMPVMDGLEATRRIRTFSDVPILGLTAHALGPEITSSLEAGMNDHLAKPFQKRDLFQRLDRLAGIRPSGDEHRDRFEREAVAC